MRMNMNNKEEVFRLAKPKRKGILPLIFSRFLIIALLFALQIGITVVTYSWLNENFQYFNIILSVFFLIMIIYLFNCSMDSSARLSWMFIIALVPIPGTLLFAFTQTNFGHRVLTKRVRAVIEETKDSIEQDKEVLKALRKQDSGVEALDAYLNSTGCFPVYSNTAVTYFPLGEDKYEAMLRELEKAQSFIFMEYFIIEEGYMFGQILKILIEKAKAGVEVRFMYDGMCEMSTVPFDYYKILKEHGIKAKAFSPIVPLLSSHYNYRDHRKILVIDGKVAFTGGVNLADEYINRKERFGHWKDTALMLKGPAVKSFTLMFLQMWNISEKENNVLPFLKEESYENEGASGFVIPYGDCPLDGDKVGEAVYMDILNRAERYVHIMTPYLILDGELEASLKFAARRGVDVSIILPGIPDKKVAYALAKAHYKELLNAGVKIFEYTPGFVHAKVFVSDDCKAVAGTINLDYRSQRLYISGKRN
jgi:cardiolipin synthase